VSLQTQVLTCTFLVVRLYCSFMMEYDIHTVLDLLTAVATAGVLYAMLATPVASTYQADLDTVKAYYVIAPCLLLAVIAHPHTSHWLPFRVMWAVCVYLEAISVLPQLRMMQNSKVVERFTAHYVFCLGLSRFFSCAHWILQVCGFGCGGGGGECCFFFCTLFLLLDVLKQRPHTNHTITKTKPNTTATHHHQLLDGNKYLLSALGSGLWPVMVLLSEVVQTFILADFCYYYVKSYADGTGIVRLPVGIV
jgi:ER lumen protein retaining receptor